MNTTYYRIKDLELIAKIENYVSYIFTRGKGWVVDDNHILMDRMLEYGGHSVFDYDEISPKEAQDAINEFPN